MKKLLSKLFFVSDCARGAAFALTLFTFGNGVALSLFHLLLLWSGKMSIERLLWGGDPGPLLIFMLGALLTTLYALVPAVVALVGLVKVLRRDRRFESLRHLVPAGLCLAVGAVGAVRVFPPLYAVVVIGEKVSNPSNLPVRLLSGGIPGVPPEYRAAVFFVSLLLILAGCLFLTAAFAAAEGKKFRSAFGAATLAVWGIFALWYLFTLGLAIKESREAAVVHRAVETRFGRPLTAAGLEKLYRESGKVDAQFWSREEKLRTALPKVKPDDKIYADEAWRADFWKLTLPDRPSAATFAWYENYCRTNRAALEKYENCFDRVPPLPEKRFVRGDLIGDPPTQCRHFVGHLEYSRLVYFLAVGNIDAAWSCYRRMGNVGAYLQKEPSLIGGMMWIRVEQSQLNGVEKLLESRRIDDAKLDELDADLAALERAIPRNHRQAMYCEAVFFDQDIIAGLEDGLFLSASEPHDPRGAGAFAPYRWIFPDWWYHAALDKKTILRIYLLPDFTHVKQSPIDKGLLFSDMMLPVLESAGIQFYALTARARGMRVLIRAEKYRRKHGTFPKTLADLPLDPFTGKPLVYEVGKAEIAEAVWKKTVSVDVDEVKVVVDAVSVRSPAEKLAKPIRDPERGTDTTRAMIRY